jgi:hypothetical protein
MEPFLLRTLTLCLRHALEEGLCSFFLIRERTNQESGPKAAAFGNRSSRRFTTNGGAFASAKFLHLRGIYPTPQMGLLLAKIFAVPFRLKFVQTQGALQLAKALASAFCVRLSCSHFISKCEHKG